MPCRAVACVAAQAETVKLMAAVKDKDEATLSEEVEARRQQAAREAKERQRAMQDDLRRQHEEVQAMVTRVHEIVAQ
jgi:hypothetical protein